MANRNLDIAVVESMLTDLVMKLKEKQGTERQEVQTMIHDLLVSEKLSLLDELLGEKEMLFKQTVGKPYPTENGGLSNIYYESVDGIRVSVLEAKRRELAA